MSKLLTLLAIAALAGCATQANVEVARMKSVAEKGISAAEACEARVAAMPEAQVLMPYIAKGDVGPSLAAQANTSKATPGEIRDVFAVHEASLPCRKIRIEAANEISPLLVASFAEYYAKADAAYLGLVERRLTWGEFSRAREASRLEGKKQYMAAVSELQRGLSQSHNAEVARRQAAASALQQWSYQQQVLAQRQQMIDAANRPRMTNCQYVGAYLSCTTF